MEVIRNYIETMFLKLPDTPEVNRAKSELLQMMEDKYTQLLADGVSENEAVGTVISEFGNIDELKKDLGLETEECTIGKSAPRHKKRSYISIIVSVIIILIIAGTAYDVVYSLVYLDSDYTADETVMDNCEVFNKIYLDGDATDIKIIKGSSYGYSIDNGRSSRAAVEVVDGCLRMKQSVRSHIIGLGFGVKGSKIVISVPADVVLEDIDMTSDVGNISISDCSAAKMNITTNVGNVNIKDVTVDVLEVTSDVGNIDVEVADLDIYDISLSTDVGEIKVAGSTQKSGFSLMATKQTSSSSAVRKSIKLTTDVGKIALN